MSQARRLLAALRDAEALASTGRRAGYCLDRASSAHVVRRGELAELWIEKRIECDRARAVVVAMKEADDVP